MTIKHTFDDLFKMKSRCNMAESLDFVSNPTLKYGDPGAL